MCIILKWIGEHTHSFAYETCSKTDPILDNRKKNLNKCKKQNEIKSCRMCCPTTMETKESTVIDNTGISRHMGSK